MLAFRVAGRRDSVRLEQVLDDSLVIVRLEQVFVGDVSSVKWQMEEDGKEVPKTEKVKPTTPDPEDKRREAEKRAARQRVKGWVLERLYQSALRAIRRGRMTLQGGAERVVHQRRGGGGMRHDRNQVRLQQEVAWEEGSG